jgi:phosphatidylethanolamine/phosphatidyl-N-methylethanolamine N-methyltransferase
MDNPLSSTGCSPVATATSELGHASTLAEVSITRAQVESSYRRYAPVYDLLFGASLGPGRVAMTRLVSRLGAQHVLEVGVGTGLTLAHYPVTARVTGVDVSRDMLAAARRRVRPQDTGRIELRAMDAEAMDFADASFDCVTLPYVLSVTPNPHRLVAEVRRVCRPGGNIVIVNHFSGQRQWRSIEALTRPLAAWLGFRTEFSLEQNVLCQPWQVLSVEPVNLLSLSRLIHVCNVSP